MFLKVFKKGYMLEILHYTKNCSTLILVIQIINVKADVKFSALKCHGHTQQGQVIIQDSRTVQNILTLF